MNKMNKKLIKEQVQLKSTKGRQAKDYRKCLFYECKTWGERFTLTTELQDRLKKHLGIEQKIVKTERTQYVLSNKVEKSARLELFRINRIRHDKKLESLAFLLDEDDGSSMKTVIDSPTNWDYQYSLHKRKSIKSNNYSSNH